MNPLNVPPRTATQADLRAAVGDEPLLGLVLEAVQALAAAPGGTGPERPNPRMMLTLLTYSYASGLFGADDVEQAAFCNPTMRYICAREAIRANDVRQFRRANRSWIEHCLTCVIAQVWVRTSPRPEFRDAAGHPQHAVILEAAFQNARRRLSLALQMDAAAAE